MTDAEEAFRTASGHAEALKRLEEDFRSRLDSAENRDTPLDPPILSSEVDRSAYKYAKVIEQFHVEDSKRYAPDSTTYCNVFARDVAWAMGVELPKGANASRMVQWLPSEAGKAEGWTMASDDALPEARADAAQAMANKGRLVIAIIPGHIAVIRPGSLMANQTPEEQAHGPAVTQAGSSVLDAAHLSRVFRKADFQRIQYWYHN